MEHVFAGRQQVIGDDTPMASPPQSLGTHDDAALVARVLDQPVEPSAEVAAHGIVGVIVTPRGVEYADFTPPSDIPPPNS
jgi:hypothetical protein